MTFVPLLVGLCLAQEPSPKFGLKDGARWTYRVTSSYGEPYEDVVVARRERSAGRGVFELKGKSIDHLGADDSGLYRYAPAHMDGTGIAADVAPELIIKSTAKVGESWRWQRPFRGQVMEGPDGKGPDMEQLKSDVTATLISKSEQIRWGKTSSNAIHVRITAIRRDGEKSVVDSWYVDGVGLVRQREQWGEHWFQQELTDYRGR